MTDVMVSLNIVNIAQKLAHKVEEETRPYDLRGNSICYNTYKTKDDKFISIGNLEPKFWANFCRAIHREDLINKHYAIYQKDIETTETLKAIFSSKTLTEWIDLMQEVDACFAPVHEPGDTLKDPHLRERGMITRIEDPKRAETFQLGFPALFSDGLDYLRCPAPTLGENTIEILRNLGHSNDKIQHLKETQVI
jgi:crotonobetainyl-CoA:carnitine CoA-transferase CaiB-like acyl-CoA transferase